MHPRSDLITGVVCGVRVEEIDDPVMQRIRQRDKLIDELAKGKAMLGYLHSPKVTARQAGTAWQTLREES